MLGHSATSLLNPIPFASILHAGRYFHGHGQLTGHAQLPGHGHAVELLGGGTYGVTVAYNDGTTPSFLIPETMATVEAVRISTLAMAVLSDNVSPAPKVGL